MCVQVRVRAPSSPHQPGLVADLRFSSPDRITLRCGEHWRTTDDYVSAQVILTPVKGPCAISITTGSSLLHATHSLSEQVY